ncbi:MAG TPA: apolipoprotein N-acyltransferase [Rhizomicrobium sp.]|jgi:apolipoprotein N-acyltransferase
MNRLVALGDFVRGLTGWRRFLFAVVAGLLSALSFAPLNIFPLMLLGFASLVLLIDGAQSHRRPILSAAFAGWSFGFGIFLGGFYWVGYAFEVDAMEHAWQIPIVECALPGGMALYTMAACAAASALWREGPSRIFVLAACYAIGEWLRGHLLTGFPWNLPAYGWGASLGVMQANALFGAYGMTMLTVLFGASFAMLADRWDRVVLPVAMTALFALFWIGGDVRLALTPTQFVPGVNLRIVQPNIPQAEKYLPEYRARNWRRLMELSLARSGPAPTHIIWPEAAPPFLLARQPEALDDVSLLTAGNTVLITGAVRAESDGGNVRFFNGLYIFAKNGQILSTYDKFHLVPFGEYLPLTPLFDALGISKLVNTPGDFTPGDHPHTFDIPGAPPVTPLICYEILFPGEVSGDRRAGWIANVTDDSWFGPPSSTGPYQHLLTARIRAIEQGLPVVRAANTGISAVVDANGRVLAALASGQMGVVDAKLPHALQPTLYARAGDGMFALLLAIAFVLAFVSTRANTAKKALRHR